MRGILLVLALLVSGCSLKPDAENSGIITNYMIPLPTNIKQVKKIKKNVKISKPMAPNFLYTNEIIYTKGDGIYGSYLYNFWSEIPAKQIEFILANALSGVFENVVLGPSVIEVDMSIESRVEIFEYYVKGEKSQVKFKGSLFLVDIKSGQVLKSKDFFITKNVPEVDPKGIVKGFGEVMKIFSDEVVDWLSFTKSSQ